MQQKNEEKAEKPTVIVGGSVSGKMETYVYTKDGLKKLPLSFRQENKEGKEETTHFHGIFASRKGIGTYTFTKDNLIVSYTKEKTVSDLE